METVTFHLRSVSDRTDLQDLENALNGVSGVAGLQVDSSAGTIAVHYDPHYVSPHVLAHSIAGAGYPLSDQHA